MPPNERPIPMYAAEPPQEPLPYGRWAEALADRFLEAAQEEAESEIGEITWFPERTFNGRTYVPAVAPMSAGGEVCGYVSYSREHEGAQATDFRADAHATEDTAADNPDWQLDLNDEEIGHFRSSQGRRGKVTLVWGEALVPNGAVATAELGPTTTDQCELIENRFTLVSLDDFTGDYIEVRLWGARGAELASEPLYEED
jgi:hypothetical protein